MTYEVLQRIAAGERAFGRRNAHDEHEGRAFDALVDHLLALEAGGLITLQPRAPLPNRVTRHGRHIRTGLCALTERGERALAHWRTRPADPSAYVCPDARPAAAASLHSGPRVVLPGRSEPAATSARTTRPRRGPALR